MDEEQIKQALIKHVEFVKGLMVDLNYMESDYNPSLKEIIDFVGAYQVLILNSELEPDKKFNRSYLSACRVMSDFLRTIKSSENSLPDATLDSPLEKLRRSIKIMEIQK